ncbi:hypothetical protein [Xylanibacter muris]|uniref:RanBP2-type domain-containing protein n=1 Tax=Xylanibacter muris TaxID=2736290 RepID=A0ABX2AK39_9BACT|nr:hypothetical protein [Xylanibacter muris]NPD91445.1 hypothetical protein [Xylanibacter muris]
MISSLACAQTQQWIRHGLSTVYIEMVAVRECACEVQCLLLMATMCPLQEKVRGTGDRGDTYNREPDKVVWKCTTCSDSGKCMFCRGLDRIR